MPELTSVLSPERAVAAPDDTLALVAQRMYDLQVEAVAVIEDDELVGIFTERDVVRACAGGADPRSEEVRRWMTTSPAVAAPDDDADEALQRMIRRRFRHLPVVDADGVLGVVSMTTLAAALHGA